MQLEIVENAISLPGCELRKNGLIISGELSHEKVVQITSALNAFEQCGQWWWGDFLCAVESEYGSTYDEGLKLASGYAYQTLANAKWVCSRFKLSLRRENLSFKHHVTALEECDGNPKAACHWLDKAEDNKWSVSEMRKQIRMQGSQHTERATQHPSFNPVGWLIEGKNFYQKKAATTPPSMWSQAEKEAFNEDFQWVEDIMSQF